MENSDGILVMSMKLELFPNEKQIGEIPGIQEIQRIHGI